MSKCIFAINIVKMSGEIFKTAFIFFLIELNRRVKVLYVFKDVINIVTNFLLFLKKSRLLNILNNWIKSITIFIEDAWNFTKALLLVFGTSTKCFPLWMLNFYINAMYTCINDALYVMF